MSDDFFKKLDKKVGELEQQAEQREEHAEQQRKRASELVESLRPILEKYQRELESRKIRTKVDAVRDYLTFVMFYADGGYNGVELRSDGERYEFVRVFTNDDGRDMTAHPGSVDLMTYTEEMFEKRLQHEIDDFVFYAKRHGGYESKR